MLVVVGCCLVSQCDVVVHPVRHMDLQLAGEAGLFVIISLLVGFKRLVVFLINSKPTQ